MAKQWIQKAVKQMKSKGTEGTFSTSAKQNKMTTQEFANYVLSHKEQFSSLQIKRANFAKNVSK